MTALSPFNGMNLDRLLEARQRERPNLPFLIWAPFDGDVKIWTYRQFAIEAAQLAGASPRGASAR